MDSNDWRPVQGTEPTTEPSDWRAELSPESRQKVVDKIIETIKKLLVSGPGGFAELQKVAQRFEEKIFTIAASQSDYLQKISLKMLAMENRYANPSANNMPSNQSLINWRPAQGTEPTTEPSDWRAELPPESRQKIVDKIIETIKNHLVSGPEGFAELQKLAQRFEDKIFTIAASQSDYLQKISLKMLTICSSYQNPSANNMPSNKVGPSNIPIDQGLALQPQVHNLGQQHLPSQPQPMPSQPQNCQQVLSQQQQQQSQNQQQLLYQHQQLLKNKLQMFQMQQKQQQSLMQPNQLQSSQQSVMQPSMKQSNNAQQSTQSMLQQHSQSNFLK